MNAQSTGKVNNKIGAGESAQDAGSTNTAESKQATSRQLIAIIFILAIATNMFQLPIFLIRTTGRDAYIAMAIGGGIDLVALGVMIAAMYLSREVDFFTLLSSTIGKVGAKIAVALIGLFLFFKLNTAVAEILAFYGNNVLNGFNVSLMTIVLLVFFAAVGVHTLRALCRLNELLVPLIVACLTVLAVIVILTGFDLANIFPSLQNPESFTDGLMRHAAWIGDFTPLVLFMGRTKLKKSTGAFAAGAGAIGTAVAVFFTMIMSAAFGNVPMLADSTTNLSNILQFSIGNVYGRIDMFSSILWSISVFIEAALFFYATCRCVAFVIGKNAHFWISLAVTVLVYIAQVFALADRTLFSLAVTSLPTSAVIFAFTIAVPTLAVTCALVQRNKRNRAERDS